MFSSRSLVGSGYNENNMVLDYKIGIDPRIFTRSAKDDFPYKAGKTVTRYDKFYDSYWQALFTGVNVTFSKDNKHGSISAYSFIQITFCYYLTLTW